MSHIHVKSERLVEAKPEAVYESISDYKKRQQILTPNFLDYTVEKGGHGAGTVMSYRLHAANRERPYEMHVEEPVQGQILTERDAHSSLMTTWTLIPESNGQRTKVRLESDWEGGTGVGGFFERTFAPLGLRSIYDNILSLLDTSMKASTGNEQPSTSVIVEKQDANAGNTTGRIFLLLGIASGVAAGITVLQRLRKK